VAKVIAMVAEDKGRKMRKINKVILGNNFFMDSHHMGI